MNIPCCLRLPFRAIFLVLLPVLCFVSQLQAQSPDSCHLRISVITCSPGAELYSTFGHTAIRVTDSARFSDIVFNYGTFDFSDPDFYMKFVRGKLNYFLSVESYSNFIAFYQQEQRSIAEQVLQLNCAEKNKLYRALQVNLQGDNRYYKYDFLFDNCTTRVRDQLQQNTPGFSITEPLTPEHTTFRNMIHSYLDKGGQPWSKLGIDVLLGSLLDDTVSVQQSMFLPDYLEKGISVARQQNNHPLAAAAVTVYEAPPTGSPQNRWLPLLVFSISGFVVLLLSQLKGRASRFVLLLVDSLLLYLTGLTGILLLLMWFGTDHTLCGYNYNLLWALPTHFIAAFFIWKRPLWIKKYFRIAGIVQIGLLLGWLFLPQHLNIALVPVVLTMAYRCFQLAAD